MTPQNNKSPEMSTQFSKNNNSVNHFPPPALKKKYQIWKRITGTGSRVMLETMSDKTN